MKPIRVVVAMEPIGKGRPRTTFVNGKVRTYTPEKTKTAEDFLRARLLKHREQAFPAHVPVRLSITFYRSKSKYLPKSMTMPWQKFDLDNAVKWALDSMNGILLADDAAITTIRAAKRFTDKDFPYITMRLEEDSLKGEQNAE